MESQHRLSAVETRFHQKMPGSVEPEDWQRPKAGKKARKCFTLLTKVFLWTNICVYMCVYTHTHIHTYMYAWKHSSNKYIPNRRSTLRVHLKLVSVFVSPTESTVQRLSLLCLRGLKSQTSASWPLAGWAGGHGGRGAGATRSYFL